MGLKLEVATLNDVPEAQRTLYVAKDGKFILDVEGAVPASELAAANGRLVEFRDNNVKILKALGADSVDGALTRAALFAGIDVAKLEKLKAIDPEEYEKLKAKVAKLKDKTGSDDPDEFDTRVKAAIDAALKPVTDKLTASEAREREKDAALASLKLREVIGEKFTKAGGVPELLDFIVDKAKGTFRIVDGAVKAQDSKFSAEHPGQLIDVDEWLKGMTKDFAVVFKPSAGGGANGGDRPGGGPRPGVRSISNPTPQELGQLKFVPGKGMVDAAGQVVEIVQSA